MKTIFILGPCFTNDGPKAQNTAQVTKAGEVRIFDSVANGYTTCHNLTKDQVSKIAEARAYSTVTL